MQQGEWENLSSGSDDNQRATTTTITTSTTTTTTLTTDSNHHHHNYKKRRNLSPLHITITPKYNSSTSSNAASPNSSYNYTRRLKSPVIQRDSLNDNETVLPSGSPIPASPNVPSSSSSSSPSSQSSKHFHLGGGGAQATCTPQPSPLCSHSSVFQRFGSESPVTSSVPSTTTTTKTAIASSDINNKDISYNSVLTPEPSLTSKNKLEELPLPISENDPLDRPLPLQQQLTTRQAIVMEEEEEEWETQKKHEELTSHVQHIDQFECCQLEVPVEDHHPFLTSSSHSSQENVTATTATGMTVTAQELLSKEQQSQQQQQQQHSHQFLFMVGLVSAVTNYVIAGASPVVTRYLQKDCSVPPMSINAIANVMVITLYILFCIVRFTIVRVKQCIVQGRASRGSGGAAATDRGVEREELLSASSSSRNSHDETCEPYQHHQQLQQCHKRTMSSMIADCIRSKKLLSFDTVVLILCQLRHLVYTVFVEYIFLWLLAILMMTRSVTNLLGPRFTKATNAQLINLCAPFMVSIISVTIYRVLSRKKQHHQPQPIEVPDEPELTKHVHTELVEWQEMGNGEVVRIDESHMAMDGTSADQPYDMNHDDDIDGSDHTVVVVADAPSETNTAPGTTTTGSNVHAMSPMTKVFSEERLSVAMVLCMVVTLIGGAMIILALSTTSFWSVPSIAQITSTLTTHDIIGMSIALFSTLVLSLNNIVLKITTMSSLNAATDKNTTTTEKTTSGMTKHSDESQQTSRGIQLKTLSGENLFVFHLFVLGGGYVTLCLVFQEDLSVWTKLPPLAYVLFVLYALSSYLVGNVVNLLAIKYFGATNTSSILALSLVSTISCSWLILGEKIHNIFQIVGGLLVMVSISLYMLLKRRSISRSAASADK